MSIIKQNIHLGFAKPELVNYLRYMWNLDPSKLKSSQKKYIGKYQKKRQFPSDIKYANIMDLQPNFELFSEYESLLTFKEHNMIENKIKAFEKYEEVDNLKDRFLMAKRKLLDSYSLFIDTIENDYNVIECDENQYEIVCEKIKDGVWNDVIAIICHDSSRMIQKTYELPEVLLAVFYVEKPNDMSIGLKTSENFPFVHSNLVSRGSGGYSISIDDEDDEDSADHMPEVYNNRIVFKSNISEQIHYHNQSSLLMSSGDIPNFSFMTFSLNPDSATQKFYSSQREKIYVIYGNNVMKDGQPRDNYDARREIDIRKNDVMTGKDDSGILKSLYIIFPDLSREDLKTAYKDSQKILTPDKHQISDFESSTYSRYCKQYFAGKSIAESVIEDLLPNIENKLETIVNVENFLGSNIMHFKPYSRGNIMLTRVTNFNSNEKTSALGDRLIRDLTVKYESKTLDEQNKIFQRMERARILLATNKNIDPIYIRENLYVREEDKLAINRGILRKDHKHVFGEIEETYEYHGDIFCKISSRRSVKLVFNSTSDYLNDIYVTDIDLLCIIGLPDESEVIPRVHVHGFINTLIVTGKVDVVFDTISEIDKSNISNIYDQMRDYENITEDQVAEYLGSHNVPITISYDTVDILPPHIDVGSEVTHKRTVIRNFYLSNKSEKSKRWSSAYIMNKNFD